METKAYIFQDSNKLICQGNWTIDIIAALEKDLQNCSFHQIKILEIDASQIDRIDSSAGLFFYNFLNRCQENKIDVVDFKASPKVKKMLSLITKTLNNQQQPNPKASKVSLLYFIGREAHLKFKQCLGFLALIGDLGHRFLAALMNWRKFHFSSIIRVMDLAGLQALPIVGLLSFLIGMVLAYQMGLQLKTYGANIYIVYLTGMAIQREFGPLITAIIVAGRTSSSFTAQLGSMKVNEEIDALTVMGMSSTELLVLPKILGMMLVFPILIFWADLFGTLGAMFTSKTMLDVNYHDFLQRLKSTLGVKQYLLGMSKAPVFSLLIAMVGCYQGFQVKGSANSVGFLTTKSVVQAIFLIIIADAIFSIFFTWLGV